MPRNIAIDRTEAENLVDLIEQSDVTSLQELAKEIRSLFGMITKEQEAINKQSHEKENQPQES